jgi:hypothetical protein
VDGAKQTVSDAAVGRLLAAMPLHAITSVYGEAGLRERLFLETAQFSAADHLRAENALALASQLHSSDERQRELKCLYLITRSLEPHRDRQDKADDVLEARPGRIRDNLRRPLPGRRDEPVIFTGRQLREC